MKAVLFGGLGYGALNYAFMFPAMQLTTASAAAVAIELYMPFSIILSVLILGERIGIWRTSGAALAFIGVVLIGLGTPSEEAGQGFALGIALMACGAMAEAVGAISVKSVKSVNPIHSTLLVSLVAHGSYYWLLQRLPIHTVAPSGLMTTVIGVAAGVVILKEAPTPILFIGSLITLSGISIILWRNKRQSEIDQKTKVTEIS